ncbi:endonuclease domain-containing protein [Aliiroseovarius sp. xm-v-208]|uniref:endonuclease domain-containing protein n=1 Tax=unclassified Aliiroseovarius TaxID=2623558 RepID=UPI00352E47E3
MMPALRNISIDVLNSVSIGAGYENRLKIATPESRKARQDRKVPKSQNLNVVARIFACVALVALGFLFPPFFVLAGFIALSLYRDILEAPEQERERARLAARPEPRITVEDLRLGCESPAEEAFLDEMIRTFELKTGLGALVGPNLRLRNQVPVGQLKQNGTREFRADFLVDEDLVVEIDGAEYHTSLEARANDQRRDEIILKAGYSILRIPAKVVLRHPDVASEWVKKARARINGQWPSVAEGGSR